MTVETDLLEEAATTADALTALVGVTDEGLKGEREELRRIADGLGGMVELVPLLAAATSAATAPLIDKLQGFKGTDGKAGADGKDGADGGIGPVGRSGADGADGIDGQAGNDGRNGVDGRNGADGHDGVPGRQGDKGLNWRGPFDGRVTYKPDDAIEFGGSSFVAVDPIRGVAPPDNGWNLLARRGVQGPSGGPGGGGVALSTAVPLVESGSGAPGSGTKASKDDHVHPADPGGGGGAHPNLAAHDALGLATDDDLAAHALTPHSDDQTAAEVPFTPAGTIAATNVQAAIEEVAAEAGSGGAPTTADYLVGTAQAGLSAEIVVGATPGGELGGTWASPSVDATHSGSAHHDPVTVGTGLDVTGQLVELDLSEVAAGGELGGFMDAPTVDATHSGTTHAATQAAAEATAASGLSAHTGDASDAHDASAVSFVPAGTIAATDVQAAIEEVAAEAGGALVGAAVARTIAAGVIDVTGLHYVIVEGEGSADDLLDEMAGGVDGQFLVLESAGNTITIGYGTNINLANQEANQIQLGNFVMQVFAVYSANDGNWIVWSNQQPRSIMSEADGSNEVIATATGIEFLTSSVLVAGMGAAKLGFFNKAAIADTVAQQTIDAPNATPEQIANILIAYGLAVQSP